MFVNIIFETWTFSKVWYNIEVGSFFSCGENKSFAKEWIIWYPSEYNILFKSNVKSSYEYEMVPSVT